jgi:hypothetical protein
MHTPYPWELRITGMGYGMAKIQRVAGQAAGLAQGVLTAAISNWALVHGMGRL